VIINCAEVSVECAEVIIKRADYYVYVLAHAHALAGGAPPVGSAPPPFA
jgi:hypothetical protein